MEFFIVMWVENNRYAEVSPTAYRTRAEAERAVIDMRKDDLRFLNEGVEYHYFINRVEVEDAN